MQHEFHLLDNALDYILNAGEHASGVKAADLKYSVLHLFAGVELLLKARLKQEHWTLLFADVNKASQSKLDSGDFRSVDFETAVNRLRDILGIEIAGDDLKRLDGLRQMRNRIQHFGASMNQEQVRGQVGCAADFVIEFIKEHLSELQSTHGEQIEEIRELMQQCDEYVEGRMQRISEELSACDYVAECPHCLQEAVPIGEDDPPRCRFCDQQVDPEMLAFQRSEIGEVFECPECERQACTLILLNNEDAVFYCFACGGRFEPADYEVCPVCEGVLMTEGEGICADCLAYKVNKDD